MRVESKEKKKPRRTPSFYSKNNPEPLRESMPDRPHFQAEARVKKEKDSVYKARLKQYGYDYEYIDRGDQE